MATNTYVVLYLIFVYICTVSSLSIHASERNRKIKNIAPLSFNNSSNDTFATAYFNYYGGPVISNVQIIPIFYGQVQYQYEIIDFYQTMVDSPMMDLREYMFIVRGFTIFTHITLKLVSQYSTSAQRIGRGYVGTPLSYNYDIKGYLEDAYDIQPLLYSWVQRGILAPDSNTYYAIHFAPNIQISWRNDKSCEVFCAYHGNRICSVLL